MQTNGLKTLALISVVFILFCTRPAEAASGISAANLDKATLRFEPNRGQAAPQFDFVSHGKGYTVQLSPTEAVIVLGQEQITMQVVGANESAQADAMEVLNTTVNYYLGNEPRQWQTGIPTYAKARYKNVYPGIDMVYYGNGKHLEYDLIVAPGADPQQIAFNFPEAQQLRVSRGGDLLITGQYGILQFHKPIIYQEVNGTRKPVAGNFAVAGTRAWFDIAQYDTQRTLVIDPDLAFSLYLGGSQTDQVLGIAADASSNLYVTGFTNSTDFLTINRAQQNFHYQSTKFGYTAAFVAKFDVNGNILYSTYFGGTNAGSNTQGNAIVVAAGNIYIAGRTDSTALPMVNPIQSTKLPANKPDHANAFVAKFDSTGNLMNSTYVGGNGTNPSNCLAGDEAFGIAVDTDNGNIYITGATDSSDLATSFAPPDCQSGFVLGMNFNNTAWLFADLIGTVSTNRGTGIALDRTPTSCQPASTTTAINLYVTGYVAPTAPLSASDFSDIFVGKFDKTGVACYQRTITGAGADAGNAITVDAAGNAYVAGSAKTQSLASSGALQPAKAGGAPSSDAFILKLGPTGSTIYASYLGGMFNDVATGIAIDAQGNVSVSGSTQSSDFPTMNSLMCSASLPCTYKSGWDVFVARFNATFTNEYYSTFIGGSSDDFSIGMAVAPAPTNQNNTFIGGYTLSADFPKTRNLRANPNTNNTGFVTLITDANPIASSQAFTAFSCNKVDIDSHFHLDCEFTLGPGNNGISPPTEDFRLSLATVSISLPPGSFTDDGKGKPGPYNFKSKDKNKVDLDVHIEPMEDLKKGPRYRLKVEGKNGDFDGIATGDRQTVTVTLIIGDDTGTTNTEAKVR